MEQAAKVRVFVSHASGEAQLAEILKQHILDDFIGLVEVFVSSDGTSIAVGEQWMNGVVQALQRADLYAVLCSQHSIERRWINIEMGAALARSKPIIPICHTDIKPGQLQRPLEDSQAIEASDPVGLHQFYRRLARELGSAIPSVDFAAFASEVRAFETRHRAQKNAVIAAIDCGVQTPTTEQPVTNPQVLCASSKQYQETIGENIELIREAFPESVHHFVSTSSGDLRKLLAENRFDIIHIAAYICPISGDLIFSEVDPATRNAIHGTPDYLEVETFVQLVKETGASLVVLPNNEALPLVAMLLPVTNVVFAYDPVDLRTLTNWIRDFYLMLAKGYSLSDACRKAFAQHQAPMSLYPQLPATSARKFPREIMSPTAVGTGAASE
ncbi:MAG: toll/interleukin-1 receptor domain-containing protein [Bryobacteraceae bacterium]